MPYSEGRLALHAPALSQAMSRFDIVSARRQAAFIAQVAHESGELRYTRELGDCSKYDGRADLGNTQPGDGNLFRAGGWLGLTGRGNYARCGLALGMPLLTNPSLIETPEGASNSAGWIWQSYGLNQLADTNRFFEITRRINGGYNGGDQRLSYYLVARSVLSL